MQFIINENWAKSQIYFSPSKEQLAIYIDGKWEIFTRNDVIKTTFQKIVQVNGSVHDKAMDDYEFNMHRHWKDESKSEDDGHGSTIKHFQ